MRPLGAELLHAVRKTDGVFGNYENVPKNRLLGTGNRLRAVSNRGFVNINLGSSYSTGEIYFY